MQTYFTKEHEWVKIKEGVASVGISDFAAHQLGDVTFVELPAVGKTVKQFEVLAAIESVKAASDIYAPVSGKVTQVNEALNDRPEIVNESAEEAAWIAWIEMADASEVQSLMTREQYDEYVRSLG
ncbi:MAG: glycine cleavage system protein GcvH [Desulfuromonadales bacterium]|nr:MAG: glycine cleavage system protein GcvH [Desulfuromonadales bacterium]